VTEIEALRGAVPYAVLFPVSSLPAEVTPTPFLIHGDFIWRNPSQTANPTQTALPVPAAQAAPATPTQTKDALPAAGVTSAQKIKDVVPARGTSAAAESKDTASTHPVGFASVSSVV